MKSTVFISDKNKSLFESSVSFKRDPEAENKVLNIYPKMKYQKVLGFGSAFTDASANVFYQMNEKDRESFIEAYFDSEKGLALNFCRTHINSCDFSADKYTYIEEGDKELETFSIKHDEEKIIPMIKLAKEKCADELKLFCSPWSPPAFMKSNKNMLLGGKLLPEFYQAWADYFVKYIQCYKEHGIEFLGLTVQNEPMALQTWESCKYTSIETLEFVKNYLYPALKNAELDTKIMIWDHNKEHAFDWADDILKIEEAEKMVWGIAFHWYSGDHFDALRMINELNPELKIIESEFCVGMHSMTKKNVWDSAMGYAHDIIGNFNNYMHATVDWNMLLDEKGGPFHARLSGCGAMMQYDRKKKKLYKTRLYDAMAHFSKFIKRDAVRLGTTSFSSNIQLTAFENPDKSIVSVIQNTGNDASVVIRIDNNAGKIKLPAKSIATIVINDRNID